MKKILYLVLVIVTISACKARKVAIQKLDEKTESSASTNTRVLDNHSDNSSISTNKKTNEQKKVLLKDSSGTITTITPAPGTTSIVKPDGTFEGQASSIKTEHHGVKNKTSTTDKTIDEINKEAKAISDNHSIDSGSNKKEEKHVVTGNKKIESKPDYNWIWYVAVIIGAAGVGYYIFRKFNLVSLLKNFISKSPG